MKITYYVWQPTLLNDTSSLLTDFSAYFNAPFVVPYIYLNRKTFSNKITPSLNPPCNVSYFSAEWALRDRISANTKGVKTTSTATKRM